MNNWAKLLWLLTGHINMLNYIKTNPADMVYITKLEIYLGMPPQNHSSISSRLMSASINNSV